MLKLLGKSEKWVTNKNYPVCITCVVVASTAIIHSSHSPSPHCLNYNQETIRDDLCRYFTTMLQNIILLITRMFPC